MTHRIRHTSLALIIMVALSALGFTGPAATTAEASFVQFADSKTLPGGIRWHADWPYGDNSVCIRLYGTIDSYSSSQLFVFNTVVYDSYPGGSVLGTDSFTVIDQGHFGFHSVRFDSGPLHCAIDWDRVSYLVLGGAQLAQ